MSAVVRSAGVAGCDPRGAGKQAGTSASVAPGSSPLPRRPLLVTALAILAKSMEERVENHIKQLHCNVHYPRRAVAVGHVRQVAKIERER